MNTSKEVFDVLDSMYFGETAFRIVGSKLIKEKMKDFGISDKYHREFSEYVKGFYFDNYWVEENYNSLVKMDFIECIEIFQKIQYNEKSKRDSSKWKYGKLNRYIIDELVNEIVILHHCGEIAFIRYKDEDKEDLIKFTESLIK